MMKKTMIITLILIVTCVSVFVLGCTGPTGSSVSLPSASPTVTPISSTSGATVVPSPTAVANTTDSGITGIDDSVANISAETDESLPEDSIPTPDAGE